MEGHSSGADPNVGITGKRNASPLESNSLRRKVDYAIEVDLEDLRDPNQQK